MPSLNNLSPKGQQIVIGVVTLFIALPLFYFAYNATSTSNPAKRGTYYDKGSGETVTNNNQTPETFGTDGTLITYLGMSGLLNTGVTKFQIAALKQSLKDYAQTRSPQALEFSITTKTIQITADSDENSTAQTATFELVVDRKDTYKATMKYFDLSSIQLSLTERDGDPIYSSKTIDGSSLSE